MHRRNRPQLPVNNRTRERLGDIGRAQHKAGRISCPPSFFLPSSQTAEQASHDPGTKKDLPAALVGAITPMHGLTRIRNTSNLLVDEFC
jgi:hypothetical protein